MTKNNTSDIISLSKYLAHAGVGSRRKVVVLIQGGHVFVNDIKVTNPGHKLQATDNVVLFGQSITIPHKIYILLNKPKDYITTLSDEHNRKTVMDLLPEDLSVRLYPVGRLDRNTTGLLLFTNDGQLAQKLSHPSYQTSKGYHVLLNMPLKHADKDAIATGVELVDGKVFIDSIEFLPKTPHDQVKVFLHSGKNRVIRRLFEHFGYQVVRLDRIYYAGLTKKDLIVGKWRYLTPNEIQMINPESVSAKKHIIQRNNRVFKVIKS